MDPNELARHYRSWADEDLVRATSFDRGDYLPEALAAIEKELSSRGVSIDRAQIEHDIRKEHQETKDQLYGVRGWLLLFVIILLIYSLRGVQESLDIMGESRDLIATLLFLPRILLSVYGLFVFVLLVRKNKKAPFHAAKWLIGTACYGFLLGVLIFLSFEEIILTPGWAMFFLVWLAYFQRSRRVALTYQQESQMSNPGANNKTKAA